jgi:hypothetical protein
MPNGVENMADEQKRPGLVLMPRVGEPIIVRLPDGRTGTVELVKLEGKGYRYLRFTFPDNVTIDRKPVYDAKVKDGVYPRERPCPKNAKN